MFFGCSSQPGQWTDWEKCACLERPRQRQVRPVTKLEVITNLTLRLSRLETIVQSVVERLDALAPRPDGSPIVLLSSQNGQTNLQSQHLTNLPENGAATNDSSGDTPASVTSVAPVFVLRDVAKEVGVNQQNQDLSNGVGIDLTLDIIDSGVLSLDATTSLLAMYVCDLK